MGSEELPSFLQRSAPQSDEATAADTAPVIAKGRQPAPLQDPISTVSAISVSMSPDEEYGSYAPPKHAAAAYTPVAATLPTHIPAPVAHAAAKQPSVYDPFSSQNPFE